MDLSSIIGPLSTLVVVMFGVFLNNSRAASLETALNNRMNDFRDFASERHDRLDKRLDRFERHVDERFDVLFKKVDEIDTRLSQIESRSR